MKSFREYLAETKINEGNEGNEGEMKLFVGGKDMLEIKVNFPTNMINGYNSGIKLGWEPFEQPNKYKELNKKLDVISKKYDKEFKDFFKKFTSELEKDLLKVSA